MATKPSRTGPRAFTNFPVTSGTAQGTASVVLANNKQIDEQVFALSRIKHNRQHAPTVPPQTTGKQGKHLKLLDGIALLLVTEDTSDVAAVSFHQTSKSIDFY